MDGVQIKLHSLLTARLDGVESSTSRLDGFTPGEKTPVPFEKEVGLVLETVWVFLEARKYVAFTGIKTLDRSARSTVVPSTLRPKVRFEIKTKKNSSLSTIKANLSFGLHDKIDRRLMMTSHFKP
jgi:hypothetical protein